MREALGPGTVLGYCTNVHAGASLDETIANLERFAVPVRREVSRDQPMGIGLWLSAKAAREARDDVTTIARRLDDCRLDPFTFNGFPFSDFHQRVVKRAVYTPDWSTPERLAYTIDLINLMSELRPGAEGSISTLPIGWRNDFEDLERRRAAAGNLRDAVRIMADIEAETGTLVHLDLEPEPGCLLDRSEHVVEFFDRFLSGDEADIVRRHLRVCHDICHSDVMFEPVEHAIDVYQRAGIAIGKVQISSAICARMEPDPSKRNDVRRALGAFAEDRYLHQTMIRHESSELEFHEDLPHALEHSDAAGEWRVHFHVPVFVSKFGVIGTTQAGIPRAIERLRSGGARHFEVETYAWDVLPEDLRPTDLTEGISRELRWVIDSPA